MSNVTTMPVWKKDAAIHERLYELAELAREKPHLFEKWCLVYAECNEKKLKVRTLSGDNTNTFDTAALLTLGVHHLFNDTVI